MKHSRPLRAVASLLASLIILTFTCAALAQSGRRANKSTQTSPPVPVASDDAAPKPSPTKEKPRVSLTIAMDDSDSFSRIPLTGQSGALQGCVDRLNESQSVKVTGVNRNMVRSDAIKKAKSNDESHVVWLRVELDRLSADSGANADIRDVFIEYFIFAPTTAKVVGSGRTYPYQRNRSVIPTSRTGGLYGDYLYVEAGRQAAEKILSNFNLPTRPVIVR